MSKVQCSPHFATTRSSSEAVRQQFPACLISQATPASSPLSTLEIELLCEKVNFGSTVKELESFVANAKAK